MAIKIGAKDMTDDAITKITDDNGNTATIAYWGSEDAARAALATLKNCKNCLDCSNCSYCSGCSGCSNCSRCSGCSDCSNCSNCSDCSDCSDCSGCSGCSDCLSAEAQTTKPDSHTQPVVPVIPDIHQTVYAAASQPKALDMANWHTCDTTHCRAGWVVALAGDAGKELERYWLTNHAAWLIYKASDPNIAHRPDFFCSNDAALADMKRLADKEAARAA